MLMTPPETRAPVRPTTDHTTQDFAVHMTQRAHLCRYLREQDLGTDVARPCRRDETAPDSRLGPVGSGRVGPVEAGRVTVRNRAVGNRAVVMARLQTSGGADRAWPALPRCP